MTCTEPLVRYGFTAGADGAGAIYPPRDGGPAPANGSAPVTIDSAVDALRRDGARFILAEVAGDETQRDLCDALLAHGFQEAGRIADFVDDGIDLRILRLEVNS